MIGFDCLREEALEVFFLPKHVGQVASSRAAIELSGLAAACLSRDACHEKAVPIRLDGEEALQVCLSFLVGLRVLSLQAVRANQPEVLSVEIEALDVELLTRIRHREIEAIRQLHRLSQLVVARRAPLQPDETRRFIRCHPEIIFNRDDGGEISRCIARQTEVNRVHILSGEDSIPGLARETYRFAETKSPAVRGRCSGRVRN